MIGASLLANGRLYSTGSHGWPDGRFKSSDLAYVARPPVVLVHGYQFDPETGDNPHVMLYPRWRERLERPVLGFGWYSVPMGWQNYLRAVSRGHYNTYRYASKLADRAARHLARVLDALPGESDILCHSLGSRVALQALPLTHKVRRVVIANGAAPRRIAREVAPETAAQVFNLMVPSDDVLGWAARIFTPGEPLHKVVGIDGYGSDAPENWTDIDREWASDHGYDFRGDNPNRILDHWYTLKRGDNWRMINGLLGGRVFYGIM